jgi:hypothetical protein
MVPACLVRQTRCVRFFKDAAERQLDLQEFATLNDPYIRPPMTLDVAL